MYFCLLQEGKGEPKVRNEGGRVTRRSGIWVKKGVRPYYMIIKKKTLLFRIG